MIEFCATRALVVGGFQGDRAKPTLLRDAGCGSAPNRPMGCTGPAPTSPQGLDFIESAAPFGTENPSEKLLHLGGQARRGAVRRDREGKLPAMQHRRRVDVAQLGLVLDMEDRPGAARGLGQGASFRSRRIRDEDELPAAKRRHIGPVPDQPLARKRSQGGRWRGRVDRQRRRPALLEPSEASESGCPVSDQSDAQSRRIER